MSHISRWCNINASKKCKLLFYAVKSRSRCCPVCKETLKSLGISIQRYKMMKDHEYKEKFVMKDEKKKTGTLTTEEYVPMHDHKTQEIVGGKKIIVDTFAKQKDLERNLEDNLEILQRFESDLEGVDKEIAKIGHVPKVKSNDEIRVERAIRMIEKRAHLEKLESQKKSMLNQIDAKKKFTDERKRVLGLE